MRMVYLDHSATSFLKPPQVSEAITRALKLQASGGRAGYPPALEASRTIYQTRTVLAELFHAKSPCSVAFTSNGTESLNIAINGLLYSGGHVITTSMEHNSVLRPLYRLEDEGKIQLTILSADRKGRLSFQELKDAVRNDTIAVVISHVSNMTGNKYDIKRVGEFCASCGIKLIVDAAQSAGVFDIDMEKDKISVLCFSGHKGLFGPQGTGGLCLGEDILLKPFKVGGSGVHSMDRLHPQFMPDLLEAGTLNSHGLAGLCAGLQYIQKKGLSMIRQEEQKWMALFYEGIRNLDGVQVYGDYTSFDRGAIVTINIGGFTSAEVSDILSQRYSICTRPGFHCAPLAHKALKTEDTGAVRFSFSHLNTEEEVLYAVNAVKEICQMKKDG